MSSNTEDFTKESWRLHPILDVPDLFPPAVMFGILDGDPRSTYRDTLQRQSAKWDQHEFEPPPLLTPEMMRQAMLRVAWDSVFHEVPGDKMALLHRNEGRQAGGEGVSGDATIGVLIGSNGPAGTKWLVTRATQFEGKTVCWCVPVDVQKGKKADVLLTVQNMITLDAD